MAATVFIRSLYDPYMGIIQGRIFAKISGGVLYDQGGVPGSRRAPSLPGPPLQIFFAERSGNLAAAALGRSSTLPQPGF